jgi:ornithine cyclodeaminase/alanine dehydrogenase-like protein (mu-crystallin family)
MRFVGAAEIDAVLDYPALVGALADAFRGGFVAPVRHHHQVERPNEAATLLLMPAWTAGGGGYVGVKVVSVFPGNADRGKPSVMGTYLLMAGDSGEPLAGFDGQTLTLWRTAAASALAARHLARTDASRLAMIGAGALAPRLIAAHAAVRPITSVTIWNRTPETAERLAAALDGHGLSAIAGRDRAAAVAEADIVSVATMSREPLLAGAWLKPGAHVDLVGAYTPAMREADDEAIRRARLYVDTRGGTLKEAGDIVQPMAAGVIGEADIAGDLADLCRGAVAGRRSEAEVTLFKSVGNAIEDLAAAVLVWQRLSG